MNARMGILLFAAWLIFAAGICALRAYGWLFGQRDVFAGRTPAEKRRNFLILTTMFWAGISPFLVTVVLLAGRMTPFFGSGTFQNNYMLILALGIVLLGIIPAGLAAGWLGLAAWRAVARRFLTEGELKKFSGSRRRARK